MADIDAREIFKQHRQAFFLCLWPTQVHSTLKPKANRYPRGRSQHNRQSNLQMENCVHCAASRAERVFVLQQMALSISLPSLSPKRIWLCPQSLSTLWYPQPKNKRLPVLFEDFASVDVCHLLAYTTPTPWAAMYAILYLVFGGRFDQLPHQISQNRFQIRAQWVIFFQDPSLKFGALQTGTKSIF